MPIDDNDFALEDGLLPKNLSIGKVKMQFAGLAAYAGISEKFYNAMMFKMLSKSDLVEKLVSASFLSESTKRNY